MVKIPITYNFEDFRQTKNLKIEQNVAVQSNCSKIIESIFDTVDIEYMANNVISLVLIFSDISL